MRCCKTALLPDKPRPPPPNIYARFFFLSVIKLGSPLCHDKVCCCSLASSMDVPFGAVFRFLSASSFSIDHCPGRLLTATRVAEPLNQAYSTPLPIIAHASPLSCQVDRPETFSRIPRFRFLQICEAETNAAPCRFIHFLSYEK
jgi:hypothetical protein